MTAPSVILETADGPRELLVTDWQFSPGGPVAEGKIRTTSGTPVVVHPPGDGTMFRWASHLVQRNAVLRAARDATAVHTTNCLYAAAMGLQAQADGDAEALDRYNRMTVHHFVLARASEPLASLWAFFDWAAEGA